MKITAKEEGTELVVHYSTDVEAALKEAARARREDSEERGFFGKRKEWRRTMTVEPVIIMEVARKLGIEARDMFNKEHAKRIWAELKSTEYKAFRTVMDKKI